MKIPTHTKNGWIKILGVLIFGFILNAIFGQDNVIEVIIIGTIIWGSTIALFIEIASKFFGKKKAK